jgi:hypothetical protein
MFEIYPEINKMVILTVMFVSPIIFIIYAAIVMNHFDKNDRRKKRTQKLKKT